MEKQKELTAADLALYLGCEVETPAGAGRLYRVEDAPLCGVLFNDRTTNYFLDFTPAQVKPLLRPLSDMTEEEAREVLTICDYSKDAAFYDTDYWLTCISDLIIGNPAGWRYLLSRRIDLFGWLESGLAIDKTKI